MSPTVLDLGQKVKAKYPGQYDDLPDDEVGRRVKSKFPGAYDDFADAPKAASIPGMEKLGGAAPAAPKVSLPGDLDPNRATPSTFQNPRTGRIGTNVAPGHADPLTNLIDNPVVGAGKVTEGVEQMAEPGVNQKAAGASKVIRGGMQAATPLLPLAAAAAPVATGAGLAAGGIAGGVTHAGLKAMGAPEGVQDLGEDVAGLAAGGFAAKRAPGALADAKTAIGEKFARDPKISMVKALKPTSTNTGFADHLDRALPELKATEPELGRKIENIGDLIEAIEAAKKRVWGQYRGIADQPSIDPYSKQPTVGTRAEAQHDMSPVADAMESTISPKLLRENPKAAQSIVNLAKVYRTPMTLQEAESILKTTNAELEGYYSKYPTAQRKALAANPQVAVKEAQASALRDTIYEALDAQGEGAAPHELKQRYGSLMNLEKEAYRRQNVADRQQPDSLSEQVGKWSGVGKVVKGVFTMNPADVAMGVAESKAAKWIKEQQTTDALIKSAMANFKGTPAPVSSPAPFQPKALLGKGDIITPPPPDASSVRSVPGMSAPPFQRKTIAPGRGTIITPAPADTSSIDISTGAPLRAPVSRQLNAGPSVRPPSDLSGPAGDITDLVPVKDPVTGKIQYIPRPNPVQQLPRYGTGGLGGRIGGGMVAPPSYRNPGDPQ